MDYNQQWYLYPHDELRKQALAKTGIGQTQSWCSAGGYSFPELREPMILLSCRDLQDSFGVVEPIQQP
jgi:hypothetical protein